MHIPDGFLDAKTAIGAGVIAAAGLGVAMRQVRKRLPPRKVPLLGLSAAFIFAAQMLNFPVLGGTSGHLIGGTLAAMLLGPGAAMVVMAAVLIVQCFLFADGGVTALGANLFNMALLAPLVGYGVAQLTRRIVPGQRGIIAAAAFGGWCSTVAAAISCAAQLSLSGIVAWSTVFPAMAGVHMVIGLGEGLITALVVLTVLRSRPELLAEPAGEGMSQTVAMSLVGLMVATGLALIVAPFASPLPDGLEKVAETLGFHVQAADKPVLAAPLADYELPGVGSPSLAVALAGAVGTLVVFGLSILLARLLLPKPSAERS